MLEKIMDSGKIPSVSGLPLVLGLLSAINQVDYVSASGRSHVLYSVRE